MGPRGYGSIAGGVLLIAAVVGCGGNAAPSGAASPTPGAPASSAVAAPSPTPSVARQEPHSLVYSATGKAAVNSVTYELDGHKTTSRSASLPWRKVVEVPADGRWHTWGLVMEIRSGRVALVGIFDRAVVGRSSGEGSGDTTTVSVSGGLRG